MRVICADNLKLPLPDRSVDLVFTSPPYEDARTYGINFGLEGQRWVDWCMPRFLECMRVCKGLVAWVVEGRTRKFQWSATPDLLSADLHRAGVKLRKPSAFYRHGICGSGGPDWLRNDWEKIICASHGRLPWSDNIAMGGACKYPVGGAMSYRNKDGIRKNERGFAYTNPAKANPGNVIKCNVGGGQMGHPLAHENEAPFPESLAEFFIRSFCPPGGTVLDPFAGSGSTLVAAHKAGRDAIGIDVRQSQVNLMERRLYEECGIQLTKETNVTERKQD